MSYDLAAAIKAHTHMAPTCNGSLKGPQRTDGNHTEQRSEGH